MHRGLKSSPDVSTIANIFHPYRLDDLDVVLDFLRLAKGEDGTNMVSDEKGMAGGKVT